MTPEDQSHTAPSPDPLQVALAQWEGADTGGDDPWHPSTIAQTGQTEDDDAEESMEDEGEEVVEDEVTVPSVPDPGEYQPKDYGFTITTYDEEGKNGKTVTVRSLEQWDELIEAEPNFGTASQLLKAQRAATRMEASLERDKYDYEAKKSAYDESKAQVEQETKALTTMMAEVNYLVSKGKLPAVPTKYANANWADPEVAKQPGVKEQIALLSYMKKENNARLKAGLPGMGSVLDAFNAYQVERGTQQTQVQAEEQGKARKQAGARVAGNTPAPVAHIPKGIMVGPGGSLRDLGSIDWS